MIPFISLRVKIKSKGSKYLFCPKDRSSHQGCFMKKVFLRISQNSQEHTCVKVSFFNKVTDLKKETLTQVFSFAF